MMPDTTATNLHNRSITAAFADPSPSDSKVVLAGSTGAGAGCVLPGACVSPYTMPDTTATNLQSHSSIGKSKALKRCRQYSAGAGCVLPGGSVRPYMMPDTTATNLQIHSSNCKVKHMNHMHGSAQPVPAVYRLPIRLICYICLTSRKYRCYTQPIRMVTTCC
jgi:hypothetical protein